MVVIPRGPYRMEDIFGHLLVRRLLRSSLRTWMTDLERESGSICSSQGKSEGRRGGTMDNGLEATAHPTGHPHAENSDEEQLKQRVRSYWNAMPCGTQFTALPWGSADFYDDV